MGGGIRMDGWMLGWFGWRGKEEIFKSIAYNNQVSMSGTGASMAIRALSISVLCAYKFLSLIILSRLGDAIVDGVYCARYTMMYVPFSLALDVSVPNTKGRSFRV